VNSILEKLIWIQTKAEAACAFVAYSLLLGIVFLCTGDVFGRYLLHRPIASAVEIQMIILIVIVYLSLAYVQQQKSHIVLDSFLEKFSPLLKQVIKIVSWFMALVPYALISFFGAMEAYKAYSTGEFVSGLVHIPTWPGKTFLAIGAFVFSCRLAIDILVDMTRLKNVISATGTCDSSGQVDKPVSDPMSGDPNSLQN